MTEKAGRDVREVFVSTIFFNHFISATVSGKEERDAQELIDNSLILLNLLIEDGKVCNDLQLDKSKEVNRVSLPILSGKLTKDSQRSKR